MNKLLALADRVEKLTGPDREVDAEIAATVRVGTEHQWAFKYPAWIAAKDGRVHLEKNGPSFAAPAFTASLDAAMTLVPKNHMWSVESTGYYARVECYPGAGESAALALTCAALRARAHGGGE